MQRAKKKAIQLILLSCSQFSFDIYAIKELLSFYTIKYVNSFRIPFISIFIFMLRLLSTFNITPEQTLRHTVHTHLPTLLTITKYAVDDRPLSYFPGDHSLSGNTACHWYINPEVPEVDDFLHRYGHSI